MGPPVDLNFGPETSKEGVPVYVSSELVSSLKIPKFLFRDYLPDFIFETSLYITAVENPDKIYSANLVFPFPSN